MNKAKKPKQLQLLKNENSAYGGELMKTRLGRSRGRPLDTKNSMHLVLRSTKAKGDWSFLRKVNSQKINELVVKFSVKYGVKVISLANVGNHLHFHIRLTNRYGYKPFIRALTAAIAMAVTGRNRWTKKQSAINEKFWDYRPFTRVVMGLRSLLNLRDYIRINVLEGFGYSRGQARYLIECGGAVWQDSSA